MSAIASASDIGPDVAAVSGLVVGVFRVARGLSFGAQPEDPVSAEDAKAQRTQRRTMGE
jgi:hypothetical protein